MVTTRRRRALSTALALVLAIESVSAVAAAGLRVATRSSGAPAELQPPPAVQAVDATPVADPAPEPSSRTWLAVPHGSFRPAEDSSDAPTATEPVRPDVVASPSARAGGRTAVTNRAQAATAAPRGTAFHGRNHVWIPTLGIDRSVAWFPCDRARAPDNLVYRWGCAGTNNVYLLGHAWGVFKPLHDAYVAGRLRKGMDVYYADARGAVRRYRVRWWRVTAPTTSASWAWAAQSVPSMTLQTCVGKDSAYRLMVRLVEVRS